jgi:hypothetical protein
MAAQVRFVPPAGRVPGKLADAELHFDSGILAGLRLVGFAVWERGTGGRNVTMPARQYSVNGERRSFALVRPIADPIYNDALRDVILTAYAAFEAKTSGQAQLLPGGGSVEPDGFRWAPDTAPVSPVPAPSAVTPSRRASAQIAGW